MRAWRGKLVDAAEAMVHPAVRGWLPAESVRAHCEAEVDEALGRVERPVRPDYRPRLLELTGSLAGHGAIVAERHRKVAEFGPLGAYTGVRDAVYADVAHRTFELERPAQLAELLRAAKGAFPRAQEIRLNRVTGAPELSPMVAEIVGPPLEPNLFRSRRLLTIPISRAQTLPDAAGQERVRVRRAGDLSIYPRYEREYLAMLEERPELAPDIPIESPDDMAIYLSEGLLFLVEMDGEVGGVMAARRSVAAGMSGYRIWEKFLFGAHRGRGLAVAAQRAFYRSLDAGESRLVFGHIHPRNPASLKAAMRDGRVDVGGYAFVRIP